MVEIAAIRHDTKKTEAEFRRLEASTRRELDHLRANLHLEKVAWFISRPDVAGFREASLICVARQFKVGMP